METGKPSQTALDTAGLRAIHQVLDDGAIFNDSLALRIVGRNAESIRRDADSYEAMRKMRWLMAMRARVAEDALTAMVAKRSVGQLVILGAGLDTYAYRGGLAEKLRIFEVDSPETQLWKRELLRKAAIELPSNLSFVPIDFERELLPAALAAAGFDSTQPAFFSWLGVVVYLTRDAILSTLRFIAGLPGGAEVVFDYGTPLDSPSEKDAATIKAITGRVADVGEVFRSFFEPSELGTRLATLGFSDIVDLGPAELTRRFLAQTGELAFSGAHIVAARTHRVERSSRST
ncbi:class I SAM-dependent methyltransferase [Tardiphaga sp. 604_B6_N1_1]|uniref:class I SAM-dependent methyltransferase n=1 Tax=unclassified Tardiphaga TaxID=2631404 RepID=UPI003F2613A0